jgi:hypothetical protein
LIGKRRDTCVKRSGTMETQARNKPPATACEASAHFGLGISAIPSHSVQPVNITVQKHELTKWDAWRPNRTAAT